MEDPILYINIILNWSGDMEVLRSLMLSNYQITFSYRSVPEMDDNTYMMIVTKPDDFDDIELEMEAIDDVIVVGCYNMDGTKYLWGNATSRNHTTQKYHARLNNKVTTQYNEETEENDIISSVPYTEEESKSVQVLLPYGWVERDLS
jgi:hypothetical protein